MNNPAVATTAACEFCQMPSQMGTETFKTLFQENQILNIPDFSTSFFIAQDVASLGVHGGHVLFIPHRHIRSLAAFPNTPQANRAAKDLTALLQCLYPAHPIFFFEHGAGLINGQTVACGGCHIDHAHAHFVILPTGAKFINIQNAAIKELHRTGWHNITPLSVPASAFFNLVPFVHAFPYLYAGMIVGDRHTAVIIPQQKKEEPVESQLYRRMLSTVIYNHPDATYWNWKDIVLGYTTTERLISLKNGVAELRRRLAYLFVTKKHHHLVPSSLNARVSKI
jgi:hypothetical protein